MGVLTKYRTALRVALLVLLLSLLMAIGSCRTLLEGTTQRVDTHTETVIHTRDTIVYTTADSATMKIISDVRALRQLIEDLKREGPRTVKGTKHASLVMQVVNDTLHLEARCDSLAHVLENALRTTETYTIRNSELERTLTDTKAERKGTIPGWMQGTIWIIVVACAAVVLLYLLLNKILLKRS